MANVAGVGPIELLTIWIGARKCRISFLSWRHRYHGGPPLSGNGPKDTDSTPVVPCYYSPGLPMHAHRHVRGAAGDRGVDELGIGMHELLRILVESGAHVGPERRVAHVREVDLVELQIRASRLGEAIDLLAVEAREITIEGVEIRISLRVDRLAATAKMHVGRRWDRLLGRDVRDGLQVREILDKDAALWARQFADNTNAGRCEVDVALLGMKFDLDPCLVHLRIPELGEEIHMPEFSPGPAIGRDLQADVLLQRDGGADGVVFELAQGFPGECALLVLLARRQKCGRAQQAANDIGAEWWGGALRHDVLP